jgi:hypothetical protein
MPLMQPDPTPTLPPHEWPKPSFYNWLNSEKPRNHANIATSDLLNDLQLFALTGISIGDEPQTLNKVLAGLNAQEWESAWKDEIEMLKR